MIFERQQFVNQLIGHIGNNMIKVVTGIRRCGKSYLLFELFHNYLLSQGIPEDHLIEIRLDNRLNIKLRNPDACLQYIVSRIQDEKQYYLLMDEVQLMDEFEDVLASCLQIKNLDCYVSGSNSHLLSSDIITEFRDRGDEKQANPRKPADTWSAKLEGDNWVGSNLTGRLLMELRDNGRLEYHLPEDAMAFIEILKS